MAQCSHSENNVQSHSAQQSLSNVQGRLRRTYRCTVVPPVIELLHRTFGKVGVRIHDAWGVHELRAVGQNDGLGLGDAIPESRRDGVEKRRKVDSAKSEEQDRFEGETVVQEKCLPT